MELTLSSEMYLLSLVFLAFLALSTGGLAAPPVQKGSLQAQVTPPPSAQVVKIGFYPVSVHQLNIADNTCYMNGWDEKKVLEIIGLQQDKNYGIALVLPVRVPADRPKSPGRIEASKIVFTDKIPVGSI